MSLKKELHNEVIGIMVVIALFFDGFQALINLIPFLGQVLASMVEFLAISLFFIWFRSYGISFATPKRGLIMASSFIIELIPFLNILPALTLAVLIVALDAKFKDFIKNPSDALISPSEPRRFPEESSNRVEGVDF